MSRITRDEILTMIPHAGAMCLLDEVLAWDAGHISCLSQRFSAPDNPLRRADGTLGTAAGIEIAAQAMALHGYLTAPAAPAAAAPVPGYLVSLRDVHLAAPRLAAPAPLAISAARLLGDAGGASYSFAITAQGAKLLSGRATVLFGAVP